MKKLCYNCKHFTAVAERVGYCNFLGVAIEKEVVILDALSTLNFLEQGDAVYNYILVQSTFSCIFHSEITLL